MYELKNSDIIIYGAGYLGILVCRSLKKIGINVQGYIDKNKAGQHIDGKEVYSVDIAKEKYIDCTIIVSMLKKGLVYDEIKKTLNLAGFDKVMHIFELRQCDELFANIPLKLYCNEKIYNSKKSEFKKVYNILEDDLSKKIYKQIQNFLLTNYDAPIDSFPIKEQYFAYDVYKKIENEVFIDCGAFIGEVLDWFIENVEGKFEKYIAIEPETINYKSLMKIVNKHNINSNIKALNLAVGNKNEKLRFENVGLANAIISDGGETVVDCVRLDDILCDEKPTFIKIDVEGYDKKVLEGACETIRQYNPVIAVAIYHDIDDLWKIPLLIKENFSNYKIYIRSYMNFVETVCYAVPENRLVK